MPIKIQSPLLIGLVGDRQLRCRLFLFQVLALQLPLPWFSTLKSLEFSCHSSKVSDYIRGRAPGSNSPPTPTYPRRLSGKRSQLSALVPSCLEGGTSKYPNCVGWQCFLFASGRMNFCSSLHSRNSVTLKLFVSTVWVEEFQSWENLFVFPIYKALFVTPNCLYKGIA